MGILFDGEKLFLFLNQEFGFWQFFHREIYRNESPEEEMKREIFEKTGVKDFEFTKNLKRYIKWNLGHLRDVRGFRGDITLFLIKINPEEKIKLKENFSEDFRWVYPEEMMDLTGYYPKVLDEISREIKRIQDFPESVNPSEFFA